MHSDHRLISFLREELKAIDVDGLSPREALAKIVELQARARGAS